MLRTACIGFCRSKNNTELSNKVNEFLTGKIEEEELISYCNNVKIDNWKTQKKSGIDIIPCNDFSMYDLMLDATCLLGNIQRRYYWEGGKIPMSIYLSMIYGQQKDKFDVLPFELQNWLDSNYLNLVPEFIDPIDFAYSDNRMIMEYLMAKNIGIKARPILISPMSYLLQGKSKEIDLKESDLLEDILAVYKDIFLNFSRININSVQIDDPMLGIDLDNELKEKYNYCYDSIRKFANDTEINLTTYRCNIMDNFDFINSLPVDTLHIDIPYNYNNVEYFLNRLKKTNKISLGIVDTRSLWKNDLRNSIDIVSKFCDKLGSDNVIVANSSPMFLCPYSVSFEKKLPEQLIGKLSFGLEKLNELKIIKSAINDGISSVEDELKKTDCIFKNKTSFNYAFYNHDVYITNEVNINKNKSNKKSNWNNFLKNNKIETPVAMLAEGFADKNKSIDIQEKANLDIVSISFSKKNYDFSNFLESSGGLYQLTSDFNVIPRGLNDYYKPVVLYDYPKIKDDIFKQSLKNVKKNCKKPIKFSIVSPTTFINFSFLSPFLDIPKIYESFIPSYVKAIQSIKNDIDILQINEYYHNNCSYKNTRIFNSSTNNELYFIDSFLHLLQKCGFDKIVSLYCGYSYLNDILEKICKLPIDLLLLESSRSGHEIINEFINYRPQIPVGIGVFDQLSNRIPTKIEVLNICKRALICFEKEELVFISDGEFPSDSSDNKILKSIEIFLKSVRNINKSDFSLRKTSSQEEKRAKKMEKKKKKNNE